MRNLKRTGVALMTLALISSLNLNALAAVEDTGYADIDAGSWYADAVEYVRDNGLMSGHHCHHLRARRHHHPGHAGPDPVSGGGQPRCLRQ